MGSGLNTGAATVLAQDYGLDVIASGGVGSLTDIVRAHRMGLSGVVIGRALYEGQVSLAEALRVHKELLRPDLGRPPTEQG